MSDTLDAGAFLKSVAQTFEEVAFVFVEEADRAATPWNDESLLEARLDFTGPAPGVLALVVSHGYAIELASNFLGVDPSETDADRAAVDALGELANILCGVVLERWFPGDRRFGMSTPVVRRLAVGDHEKAAREALLFQSLVTDEGQRIDAAVYTASPAAKMG